MLIAWWEITAVISEVALLYGEDISTLTTMKKGKIKSNTPRKMALYIARKYGDYRYKELADAFGLQHYGGASYAVYAFTQELQKDRELEMSVNKVINKLRIAIGVDQSSHIQQKNQIYNN